jgi:hypothetical protein
MADDTQPCGYTVRLSAKWASLGVVCPKHGAMEIIILDSAELDAPTAEIQGAPQLKAIS